MPRKKDPWAAPPDDSWIAKDKLVIPRPDGRVVPGFGISSNTSDWVIPANQGKKDLTPWDLPHFIITRIETTGNKTQMVHFEQVNDPKSKGCRWKGDFQRLWMPAPKPKPKPRVPKPKPEPKPRFEREDVI